jgi:PhnB protein
MSDSWKPAGYTSVAPYLVAPNSQQVIDFLKAVFDASELRRYHRPDGSIMHAEVRIGDTVVMLGDATTAWTATETHLHVYVPDANAVYERAIAAGGVPIQPPLQKSGDEDRRGGFKDPAGNSWWVATQES